MWKLYIKTNENYNASNLIKKVIFRYGKNKKDQKIVTESPFEAQIERPAKTQVTITIFWKDYLKEDFVEFSHPLVCYKRGKGKKGFFTCWFNYKPMTKK